MDGQGNLENLKKNGYGRQSSENLFCSRGERMYFLRDSLSPSPSSLIESYPVLLKERICSLGEQILSFKSTPKFKMIKIKIKNDFLNCQRVWKTVKCQGKISEKSRNLEVDDKWQPY